LKQKAEAWEELRLKTMASIQSIQNIKIQSIQDEIRKQYRKRHETAMKLIDIQAEIERLENEIKEVEFKIEKANADIEVASK
jgi:peptidoglycan hydrolase CwlO-like protein